MAFSESGKRIINLAIFTGFWILSILVFGNSVHLPPASMLMMFILFICGIPPVVLISKKLGFFKNRLSNWLYIITTSLLMSELLIWLL